MAADQHDFLAELRRMLEHVAPRRLDQARTVLAEGTRELVLAHDREPDWDIHVAVDPGSITVGTAGAHEHFYAEAHEAEDPRPWTVVPVDFIAELLRGEIEVRRHYRGRHVVKIEHGRTEGGSFEPFTSTIPMSPGFLMPWAEKRVETERPDFEATH
jgi:hypothetical protein